ncbi:MAG: MlaE family lipid ABC transporter permease subunit [Thermostichales cyanobacterium SZTDM-1c_bins_54]
MNWLARLRYSALLGGQVTVHLLRGKIHRRNTLEQLAAVGVESLFIVLLTAVVISGVFTIQVAREFIRFGASSLIGGVLSLALARELTPVITAVILAGRMGSAFAAELGTMKVSEQMDALLLLRTDPVDYLVVPRVIACGVMVPMLALISLVVGLVGGMVICRSAYGIATSQFLNSAQTFLQGWDLWACTIKALVFGVLVAIIGCGWGMTTSGGAKGVGKATTDAVVTSLLAIFVSNFFLSWLLFQGPGSVLAG